MSEHVAMLAVIKSGFKKVSRSFCFRFFVAGIPAHRVSGPCTLGGVISHKSKAGRYCILAACSCPGSCPMITALQRRLLGLSCSPQVAASIDSGKRYP